MRNLSTFQVFQNLNLDACLIIIFQDQGCDVQRRRELCAHVHPRPPRHAVRAVLLLRRPPEQPGRAHQRRERRQRRRLLLRQPRLGAVLAGQGDAGAAAEAQAGVGVRLQGQGRQEQPVPAAHGRDGVLRGRRGRALQRGGALAEALLGTHRGHQMVSFQIYYFYLFITAVLVRMETQKTCQNYTY